MTRLRIPFSAWEKLHHKYSGLTPSWDWNSTTQLQMETYHDWKIRSNAFYMTYHGQRMNQEDLEYKAVAIHRPLQSWTSPKQLPWSGRNYIFMDGFMWLDIQGRDHNSLGSSFCGETVEKISLQTKWRAVTTLSGTTTRYVIQRKYLCAHGSGLCDS